MNKRETEARIRYDANKQFAESVGKYLGIKESSRLAKEQDELHLIICEEEDKRSAERPEYTKKISA